MSDLSSETRPRPLAFKMTADGRPMILDVDLAERLGYRQLRTIRSMIRRQLKSGFLNDSEVRCAVPQTSTRGGRPGKQYWLTREAALLLVGRSETKEATRLIRAVIEVFLAVVDKSPQLALKLGPTDAEKRERLAVSVKKPGVGLAIARYGHLFDYQVLREVVKYGFAVGASAAALRDTVEQMEEVQSQVDALDARMTVRRAALERSQKTARNRLAPTRRALPSGERCLALVPEVGVPASQATCA